MFSNLLDRLRRNLSLRLTFWYAAVSLLAYIIIFSLAYYSLSSSLVKEDREVLLSKFKEYAAAYQEGELTDLEALINSEKDFGKPVLFFVRIASPDNSTLFLSFPDQWATLDLKQIPSISVHKKYQRLQVMATDYETVFEIVSLPLQDGYLLQIGKEIKNREETLARFRNVFAGVMAPAILIGLLGGYLLTFRALRPIRNLTQTVRSIIDTGKMESRVSTGKTEDELAELILLFNRMSERIGKLIKGMREALDNVAHDLRTPIARLRGTAEMALQSSQKPEDCREALADCMEESERIVKMLDTIMDISEAEAGTLKLDIEQVDLSELINEVVDLYRYVAEEKNVGIHTAFSGGLHLAADPNRMRQVVANLLDNAVKYTPAGGKVDVEALQREKEVIITVKDNGIGINREDLPKVWDRHYRGDESRAQRGLGLGLSVVKSIVEIHSGQVEVSSEPGAGSTFSVYLPQST